MCVTTCGQPKGLITAAFSQQHIAPRLARHRPVQTSLQWPVHYLANSANRSSSCGLLVIGSRRLIVVARLTSNLA